MDRQAEQIIALAIEKHYWIRSVESCTGGMVFSRLTSVSGASAVLDRGFITYSNKAKCEMVGVRPETLANFGAVSDETAKEMAIGGLLANELATDDRCAAISITGIAGPDGGTTEKPVGLVHMACAMRKDAHSAPNCLGYCEIFKGDRQAIRMAASNAILSILLEQLTQL